MRNIARALVIGVIFTATNVAAYIVTQGTMKAIDRVGTLSDGSPVVVREIADRGALTGKNEPKIASAPAKTKIQDFDNTDNFIAGRASLFSETVEPDGGEPVTNPVSGGSEDSAASASGGPTGGIVSPGVSTTNASDSAALNEIPMPNLPLLDSEPGDENDETGASDIDVPQFPNIT